MKDASRPLALLALLVLPWTAPAAETCLSPRALARLSPEQLDALFAGGKATVPPAGFARGTILRRVDGKLPRVRARLQGAVWKGKVFRCDGSFINQWAGLRAIESRVAVGTSWYDGQPCLVLEYPAGTPIFGNTRDELREIAPGVWLGRFYARCPCGKLEGYFVLEAR